MSRKIIDEDNLETFSYNVERIEDFERHYETSFRIDDTIDLNRFELIITLGKGAFGRVILVVLESDNIEYALKVLDKSKIVKYDQIKHVQSEIRILNAIQHPNIIQMYSLFQDNSYLYILLEYVHGGDLFSYLKRYRLFSEYITIFFAAQIVLVFEYLHFFNIIYRDLKPENILIDNHGYLKVADFGFAKRIQQRTYTLCGTPDYFSPEIIQSKGHGKATDWWTLGILIYEMSTGTPPFKAKSEDLLFEAICRKRPPIRTKFSLSFKSIILQLLQKDPIKRLGSTVQGSKDIKEHSWFNKINFDILYTQQLPSPFYENVLKKSLSDYRRDALKRNEKPLIISNEDDYIEIFKDF
ncbi:hypothetical protein I4U23_026177 [Adineta vaga]|nr:hypothetical protein I4U23_026177 [Adineta vaga]